MNPALTTEGAADVAVRERAKATSGPIIAAIDLGPSSARVLSHAAGLARLLSARVRVLHVSADSAALAQQRLEEFCRREGPCEVDPDGLELVVRPGIVSDNIHREARKEKASLVVIGSRTRGRLSRLVLGSTSAAVLRSAACPILLVPPIDFDIVDIADRARLTSGPVLAAVDLGEDSARQLRCAEQLARLAGQGLLLMTVAPSRIDEHAAGTMLRERSHRLSAPKPHALIVRRGNVAEEISRCAVHEGAGLVVMGLRERRRGTPGVVASAVLKTRRTFVLAVPCC
jgi:nucleotide-binding universal stress UspA family protein